MDNIQQHLTKQLTRMLNPLHLEVINESSNHSGLAMQSHFKIVVVSDYFSDLKLIDRHRFINQLFKKELNHIHALAIHTYTLNEWEMKNGTPASPKCTGAGELKS